jgi:hypothetical protein
MPINVPDNPKVYTTKYQNFKGVDFTNDPTNVWYRRSPSGVNMLPDESGRPFKRHGWNILLSNSDICTALSVPSCTIKKCAYFELAGVDHIVVFTNYGVLFYNKSGVTATSTDYDCYMGYDRCFFFEGDGTSAFYIYGNFKVWRYEVDDTTLSGFAFNDVTSLVDIPTVLISTSANCTGTPYYGYNLLGTKAAVEYCENDLFAYWGTDGLAFAADKATFTTAHAKNYSMVYTYKTVNGTTTWYDSTDTAANFVTDGITVMSTPSINDQIFVVNVNGVLLPNNVSPTQYTEVTVQGTKFTQFDYTLETINTGTPTVGQCLLKTDPITAKRERQTAWIEFNTGETFASVDGEDYIKVSFPSVRVEMTPLTGVTETATASLVGA